MVCFGCALADSEGGAGRSDAGPIDMGDRDGGFGDPDAPASDAGVTPGVDGGPPELNDDGFPADPDLDTSEASEDVFLGAAADLRGAMTCYDGQDNDGDLAINDCAVAACQVLASCCIGSAGCCELPETRLDLACGGGDLLACLAGTSVFGAPEPFLDGDALAMGGDATYDSGLLGDEVIDLRTRRVELEANLAVAECTDGACLESVAFGLTAQDALGDSAHVNALAGLIAAEASVHVVIGGNVVDVLPMSAGEETWTLSLDPTGTAHVAGPVERRSYDYQPTSARAVVWGHSRNPSATLGEGEERARLRSLTLTSSLCEIPSAWERPSAPLVFDGAEPVVLETLQRVSVARGTETWVLLTLEDGRALFAREIAPGLELLSNMDGIAPSLPEWAAGARDWTLAVDPAVPEAPYLYFLTDTSLGRARWDGSVWLVEGTPVGALRPGFGAPSVLYHRGHLVVVGTQDNALTAYLQEPGDSLIEVEGSLAALSQGALQPSVVVHGSAYEVHYSRRIGTRWQVGLLASDELVAWRTVDDRILRGGGTFDRLGASAPAAISEEDAIRMYYVGHDGVRTTLGSILRAAADGPPPERRE